MEGGPGSMILRAIDSADDIVHNARSVPFTGQLRIRQRDLDAAVSRLRDAAAAEGIEGDGEFTPALDRLASIASNAVAIPLTDEMRCDREEVYAAVDALRARIPQRLKEARWDWKEAGGTDPPGTDEITIEIPSADSDS